MTYIHKPIILSNESIPVDISNCAFLIDGFVPGIVGNLVLTFVISFVSEVMLLSEK